MVELARLPYLRPARSDDDAFLYDVFCSTWQEEVAALPDQSLARHVLRIQHVAQERRFDGVYPGHQRFVVWSGEERAGRFYLFGTGAFLHIVDLTLLPRFRSQGIGGRLVRDLMSVAAPEGRRISLRASRGSASTDLWAHLGLLLVSTDDREHYFEWAPASVDDTTKDSSHSVP